MFVAGGLDGLLDGDEFLMGGSQVDFLFSHCCADVAGDVQVEVVFLNIGRFHPAGAMDRNAKRNREQWSRDCGLGFGCDLVWEVAEEVEESSRVTIAMATGCAKRI